MKVLFIWSVTFAVRSIVIRLQRSLPLASDRSYLLELFAETVVDEGADGPDPFPEFQVFLVLFVVGPQHLVELLLDYYWSPTVSHISRSAHYNSILTLILGILSFGSFVGVIAVVTISPVQKRMLNSRFPVLTCQISSMAFMR